MIRRALIGRARRQLQMARAVVARHPLLASVSPNPTAMQRLGLPTAHERRRVPAVWPVSPPAEAWPATRVLTPGSEVSPEWAYPEPPVEYVEGGALGQETLVRSSAASPVSTDEPIAAEPSAGEAAAEVGRAPAPAVQPAPAPRPAPRAADS
jgi:hypothetical protein